MKQQPLFLKKFNQLRFRFGSSNRATCRAVIPNKVIFPQMFSFTGSRFIEQNVNYRKEHQQRTELPLYLRKPRNPPVIKQRKMSYNQNRRAQRTINSARLITQMIKKCLTRFLFRIDPVEQKWRMAV